MDTSKARVGTPMDYAEAAARQERLDSEEAQGRVRGQRNDTHTRPRLRRYSLNGDRLEEQESG